MAFRIMVGKQLHVIIYWMFHQLESSTPRLSKAACLVMQTTLRGCLFWEASPDFQAPWHWVRLTTPFHSISAQAWIPDTPPVSVPDNQLRHFCSSPVVVFSCLQCLGQSLAHGRCSPNTCRLNKWTNVPTGLKVPVKERIRSLLFNDLMESSVPGP